MQIMLDDRCDLNSRNIGNCSSDRKCHAQGILYLYRKENASLSTGTPSSRVFGHTRCSFIVGIAAA